MTISGSFTKQPSETYKIAIEFSERLPTGTALSSVVWSAEQIDTGSDATATVIDDVNGEVSGTQARVIVKAGTSGKAYKLTATVTLDDTSILEEDLIMAVVEI